MIQIIQKKEVQYYKTPTGMCPYIEWRNEQDSKTQAILAARILMIEAGNVGFVKSLGDGVHELKIDFGPGLRIYFGNAHGRLVIVLTAGAKQTQPKDVAQAKVYWKEWKSRLLLKLVK